MNVQFLKYFDSQQIQPGFIYRWLVRLYSQFATLVAPVTMPVAMPVAMPAAILVVMLAGCSEQPGSSVSADSPPFSISPPGVERLARVIDPATFLVRIFVTAQDIVEPLNPTPVGLPEGSWTASVLVPQGVPFSIEVVWSAVGIDAVRVDYARLERDYPAIALNSASNLSEELYDMSASTFDDDGDGISNFDELVADTPPTGALSESALVYYPLDTSQAIDLSGNKRNGLMIGGVAAADESGTIDSAMRLGASMEHVVVPAAVVDGLQDFTVLFKVNFDTFNEGEFQYNTVFSVASQERNELILAYANNETTFPLVQQFFLGIIADDGSASLSLFDRSNAITLNSWHCVAVYRKGAVAGLVVDGVLIGNEAASTATVLEADTGGVLIGQEQAGIGGDILPGMALAGVIDEIYIFDSVLELQDIQNACN